MKRKTSKTQLAILSLLAGIVYLFMITAEVVSEWKSSVRAFREGAEQAESEILGGDKISWENFEISLEPKEFDPYYTDSLRNSKTGEFLPISYEKLQVRYKYEEPRPTKLFLLEVVLIITAFPALILYVLILILFYKLILAFYKDNIFTNDNVRRLKLLGIYSISLYALHLLFSLTYYFTAVSLIALVDYKVKMLDLGHETLLMGILVLIATNVLKRSIVLKEEQELTI